MTLTSAAFHAIMLIFQVGRSSPILRSKPMIGATIPTYFVSPRRSIKKHDHVDARRQRAIRFDRRKHTQVDFKPRQFTAET
ncbi:hypothetical protein XI09_05080 [Bradyrhizobium sp. CCBAU 11386]|nr:hypothetical protein [Bradyrhizobium sp. CCBAU 11386]